MELNILDTLRFCRPADYKIRVRTYQHIADVGV